MGIASDLAGFVETLSCADLPAEIIARAKELVLDQLGVELCASTLPWSCAARRCALNIASQGASTVVRYGDRMHTELAAFVNGVFGHGFELDDTHAPSNTHPGCVIIPTALAVGESQQTGGKRLVEAIVAGYEVMCRIGRSMTPSLIARGHHPTASVGPFGAAAVTGKIMAFGQKCLENSLSIAGGVCSGLMEFSRTGGNVKRLYGGLGAEQGIRASLLAQEGLTGPALVLEGEAGFCRAFSDEYRCEDIMDGIGRAWIVSEIGYKRYPTDYHIQAPLDAMLKLRSEHSIDPSEVADIAMLTNKAALGLAGSIREPKDMTEAQFSAGCCLAVALVRGSFGVQELNEVDFGDALVLSVADKVRLEVDQEVQAVYPRKRAGGVVVRMKDGRVLEEKVMDLKGSPTNPMTPAEVKDKFRSLASPVLPRMTIEDIVDCVDHLEDLTDVSELTRLLVADQPC